MNIRPVDKTDTYFMMYNEDMIGKIFFVSALVTAVLLPPVLALSQSPSSGSALPETDVSMIQFNNLTISSIESSSSAATITVSPSVEGAIKNCAKFDSLDAPKGIVIDCPSPPAGAPSYTIEIKSDASLTLRNRAAAKMSDFEVGDRINVFGIYGGTGIIRANVVADLSKPRKTAMVSAPVTKGTSKPAAQPSLAPHSKDIGYEGIITQINAGDGTFVMRTRDGKLLTVANPIQVNNFVSVKGTFDKLSNAITEVFSLMMKKLTEANAIPFVSKFNPGSGGPGTQITVSGSGFAGTGNEINFGNVKGVLVNLKSPDGKTITFTVPGNLCPKGASCGDQIKTGDYQVSVANQNGISNAVSFSVTDIRPLAIKTEDLPQVIAGVPYSASIEAVGGIESYIWSVSDGSIPPGLAVNQPVCASTPCRTAAKITGVPTKAGSYTFTINLQSGQEKTSRSFTIVVVQPLNNGY